MSKVIRNNKAGPGILLGATLNKTKQVLDAGNTAGYKTPKLYEPLEPSAQPLETGAGLPRVEQGPWGELTHHHLYPCSEIPCK